MGQVRSQQPGNSHRCPFFVPDMGPPMKAMKAGAKAMTKGALAAALAEEHSLKKTVCSQLMNSIAALATKAGKKMIFGKEVHVKAKPAKTIVKAYPVAAI